MTVYGVFYGYSDYEDGGYELVRLFTTKDAAVTFKTFAIEVIKKNVELDDGIMSLSNNITNMDPEFAAACKAHEDHVGNHDFLDMSMGCVDSWDLHIEELEVFDEYR